MALTVNCSEGTRHYDCDGYCAPLVYSNTKPCACSCHDGIYGRDFARAQRRAEKASTPAVQRIGV